MIDKITDDSLYNRCEFCTEKAIVIYFDTEHLGGTGKPSPQVLSCKTHEMDAIHKLNNDVHILEMSA